MEVLKTTWGIAPSPALETLCKILEKYEEKEANKCRKYSHSFAEIVSKISDLKDLRIKIYLLRLAYQNHVKAIESSKVIPNEAKSFLLNIISKLHKQKQNSWSKETVNIKAKQQREAQLIKNKQNKQNNE